jgi:hypothetical protein
MKQLIIDANNLPHPKNRIKQALVLAIRSTTDSKMREHLKSGYIMLAYWQSGIGNTIVKLDVIRDDIDKNITELLDQVSSQMPGMERWIQVVKAEADALKLELQQLVLW